MPPKYRLSDDITNNLAKLCLQGENTYWQIGDYIISLIEDYRKYVARRAAIKHVCSVLAHVTHWDEAQLREVYHIASKIPADKRDTYAYLSYYQLRACLKAGKRWEYYAGYVSIKEPTLLPADIITMIKANGDYPRRRKRATFTPEAAYILNLHEMEERLDERY